MLEGGLDQPCRDDTAASCDAGLMCVLKNTDLLNGVVKHLCVESEMGESEFYEFCKHSVRP